MSDTSQTPPPEEPTPYPPAQGGYQPGMAPQSPMQPAPGVGQPADLMSRFLARLIDYALLAAANIVIVTVIVLGLIMGASPGGMMGPGESSLATIVSSILGAAVALGYFALMESSRGQTVGKMVMKLETRGRSGGRPTLEEALRRNAFTAIGIIGIVPVLGWFLSPVLNLVAVITIAVTISNNTATRQGWHDQFAGGTSVVKIG